MDVTLTGISAEIVLTQDEYEDIQATIAWEEVDDGALEDFIRDNPSSVTVESVIRIKDGELYFTGSVPVGEVQEGLADHPAFEEALKSWLETKLPPGWNHDLCHVTPHIDWHSSYTFSITF